MYEGSHVGKPAIDFAWWTVEDRKCYAPFDCIIKRIYTQDANEVWIESKEPVLYADGTIDYMTMLLIHDDNVANLHEGQELKQGEYFYDMGNKGNSAGIHLHLEVGRGKFHDYGWYQDANTGKWRINDGLEIPNVVMLSDDTRLGSDPVYNWKYAKDVPFPKKEEDKKVKELEELVSNLEGQIVKLKEQNNILLNKIEELEEKANIEYKFEYKVEKDGKHQIELYKNETLLIK